MSPSTAATIERFEKFVIGNYRRYPVALVRGEGSTVWDSDGREYLDFFPGWGCNLLGHCPAKVVQAVQEQVAKLIHVPNTWYMEQQGIWAELLSQRTEFAAQAFFCNSGTEANEAAIKLARLHTPPDRYKIITFTGGFHGRTLGSLTATAQPKYHEGLGPLMAGFAYCPLGDLAAVRQAIDETTAAIMIEPIQGEGGVRMPPAGFLAGLRELADQHELLLIFDEVQTGCGRTGTWFAHQYFDVQPDIMTLAKSLCAGIAGGALLARPEVADSLKPGMHAATFGGNPIAAAAGIAMIETIEEEGLLASASELGEHLTTALQQMASDFDFIREVRSAGVMIGIELDIDGSPIVEDCLRRGLLINCTQGTVLRLLPAMNLSKQAADQGLEILQQAFEAAGQHAVES
ncbi:aspartate aminotransferase family protein [Planctomycetaceae bacterium SH139]